MKLAKYSSLPSMLKIRSFGHSTQHLQLTYNLHIDTYLQSLYNVTPYQSMKQDNPSLLCYVEFLHTIFSKEQKHKISRKHPYSIIKQTLYAIICYLNHLAS